MEYQMEVIVARKPSDSRDQRILQDRNPSGAPLGRSGEPQREEEEDQGREGSRQTEDRQDDRPAGPAVSSNASLKRFHSLVDAWESGDDWTGVTSTAERKKRQNRINQRAYRRRKMAARQAGQLELHSHQDAPSGSFMPASFRPAFASLYDSVPSPLPLPTEEDCGPLLLVAPQRIAYAKDLLRRAYAAAMRDTPSPLHTAPTMSLGTLIRLNALNALANNARILNIAVEGLCRDEFESPFAVAGPHFPPTSFVSSSSSSSSSSPCSPWSPPPSYPSTLHPTRTQRTLPHHPWVDLFPFPRFRDNVLKAVAAGWIDEDTLCAEIIEVDRDHRDYQPKKANADDESATGDAALIVWGNSADAGDWEASPAFLRRWGKLVQGCPELIESTNVWRSRRGQHRIVFPT